MSEGKIRWLQVNGVNIVPHGVSHSALCIYSGDKLLGTRYGGIYQNTPYGKGGSLTENEVLSQLLESKKALEAIGIKHIEEFVLPYGLYNREILEINRKMSIYKHLSTCDEYLDSGELLRPRFLITNDLSVELTIDRIMKLKPREGKIHVKI